MVSLVSGSYTVHQKVVKAMENSEGGPWSLSLKNPEWFYYALQLTTLEPQDDLHIDSITWKMLIGAALTKMHGILGESANFDILQVYDESCIIRTSTSERQIMESSLVAYRGNLKSFRLRDVMFTIRVVERSQYLVGVAGPSRRDWLSITKEIEI
ncbi:unnamed protein product [Kuraishia capsulata CBS 1993]|uniref:Ribonucleases P/MRP subunit Pop8-like domain-containing protein n=1 Tax=Kuraishia capsulata CBS 1993 TaxID=1382522 RepID=W6MQT2_9ASCO|nr:uncharacterized protein KUCA_T00005012001 [Kuraishia capsulata CBS 1993]CDK29026.1 unnamed protein product [Kuraishia capsulata CBS 1993]